MDTIRSDPGGPQALAALELVESRLHHGETVRLRIKTGSMHPTLRCGDWVIIAARPAAEVKPGAVVSLRRGRAWIVHRLIGRLEDRRLWTKGDAAVQADAPWDPREWIGVIEQVKRGERIIDLRTRRSRWLGWLLARLSRLEAHLYSLPAGQRRLSWLIRGGLRRTCRQLAGWTCSG